MQGADGEVEHHRPVMFLFPSPPKAMTPKAQPCDGLDNQLLKSSMTSLYTTAPGFPGHQARRPRLRGAFVEEEATDAVG